VDPDALNAPVAAMVPRHLPSAAHPGESMKAVLALDQGTTGSTALVVGEDGAVHARAYSEFTQHFPRPGWVEHDAGEIWEVTRRVGREALDATDAAIDVVAIGITNQRETVVVWDRDTLEPVHRAIVWQDRRTAGICQGLKQAGHEPDVRERTGLVLDPYFSGTKLAWLLREHPEIRVQAEEGGLAAGTIDAWLIARLTGGAVHATDPTNASRTLLFDIRERAWSPEMSSLLGVPLHLLPEVRPSAGDFGVATADVFGRELPIRGVAGDQQAALFGQGCWSPGLAKNTYGTGAFLLMYTGDAADGPQISNHGLLTTVACAADGSAGYALEGSVFVAGAAVQWLRDGLGLIGHSSETEALAASVESTGGVYFVPAFVGLGAPHWDPEARGTIVGVTRGTTRAHLVRSALEAMAYRSAELLDAMQADAGVELAELRVDGGATENDWLMRFQAEVLRRPVRRPAMVETTALGAAGLAGIAGDVWRDGATFAGAAAEASLFEPGDTSLAASVDFSAWSRAVRAARAWAAEG
jgi:glycerol kinase